MNPQHATHQGRQIREAEERLARGNTAGAREIYRRLARQLDQAELWVRLAEIDRLAGQPELTLRHLARAANSRRDSWQTSARIAELYFELGHADKSLALLERESARRPDHPLLKLLLGQAHEDMGQRDKAIQVYQQALEIKPGWPAPLGGLLRTARAEARPEWIELGKQALFDPGFPADDRAALGYALGRVLELHRQHDDAFSAWREANTLRRQLSGGLDHAAARQHIDKQIARYPAEALAQPCRLKERPQTPIFIVGMPRSGTTLLERMLSAHPQAAGLGELPTISLIARQLDAALPPSDAPMPPLAERHAQGTLQQAVDFYHDELGRRGQADTPFVVDKAPMNLFHAGLIAQLFANARIIHCQRDPRDVCLSIYSENFAIEQGFATDLDDLVTYYREQERLAKHWLDAMPDRIRSVHYEDLVDAPANVLKPLLEWIGMPWHDRCLAHHRQSGGVHTPSKWQVTEPVYRSSIGRWKPFREHIAPLLSAFGDRDSVH